jgi:hypothetical protein
VCLRAPPHAAAAKPEAGFLDVSSDPPAHVLIDDAGTPHCDDGTQAAPPEVGSATLRKRAPEYEGSMYVMRM